MICRTFCWRRFCRFFIGMIICAALLVCAPPLSAYKNPKLDAYMKEVKGIGLAPASVNIYALRSDDTQELIKDWSDKGRENISKAVIESLKRKSIEIQALHITDYDTALVGAVHARYRSVCTGIYSATTATANSVGNIDDITKKYGVEALLFVDAEDEISTAGREMTGFLNSMMIGLMTQGQGSYQQRTGITVMRIGLVDKSGLILWYIGIQHKGGYDLRDTNSAEKFVNKALSDFPTTMKKD